MSEAYRQRLEQAIEYIKANPIFCIACHVHVLVFKNEYVTALMCMECVFGPLPPEGFEIPVQEGLGIVIKKEPSEMDAMRVARKFWIRRGKDRRKNGD